VLLDLKSRKKPISMGIAAIDSAGGS